MWVRISGHFFAPVTSLPLSRLLPSSPDPASIAGNILVLLWLRALGSSFLFYAK
ncbi:hypothetical protein SLEP1_g31374 [Rubroshorea leprosula]|uniref:Uncharacterized protein n=1 Tax=Rubroshorea leprosula TaxID=152421 RepID=A0AAV5KB22_9ROSI|nr:hypothetical protein SLEP1_g31374 [Rubroshorea leprosula]